MKTNLSFTDVPLRNWRKPVAQDRVLSALKRRLAAAIKADDEAWAAWSESGREVETDTGWALFKAYSKTANRRRNLRRAHDRYLAEKQERLLSRFCLVPLGIPHTGN